MGRRRGRFGEGGPGPSRGWSRHHRLCESFGVVHLCESVTVGGPVSELGSSLAGHNSSESRSRRRLSWQSGMRGVTVECRRDALGDVAPCAKVVLNCWKIQVTRLRAESLRPLACPSKNHWSEADAILVASVDCVVRSPSEGFAVRKVLDRGGRQA